METKLHFMIVAADPLVRAGLAAHIDNLPDCEVVSLANPSEFISDLATAFEDRQANIAIWDWGMDSNESDSLDFQKTDIPVITLLTDISQAEEALATGAKALLKRNISAKEIFAASKAVLQGLFVIDPDLVATIRPPRPQRIDDLKVLPTQREEQVLQLMAEGFTNKAIAQQLGISQHTVKFHVNSILSKLNAQSRTEAVVQATRLGLIAL